MGVFVAFGETSLVLAAPDSPEFQQQILPLLYGRCFSCHSEKQEKPKAELRLDSVEGIREGAVIVPGNPDKSEMLRRVSLSLDDEDHMPPLKGGAQPLTESEVALFRRWIADGANFGTWTKFIHREPAIEYAETPLSQADVPQLARQVDGLVDNYHKAKGTRLNAPVSDTRFMRRVYLDIAGRIPSLAESNEFLQNSSSDRRAKLIDTLLNSGAYVSHTFNWKADQLRLLSEGIPGQPGRLYDEWVREAIASGMKYDEFVRKLVTASGYLWENGAVGFYVRDLGMPLDHMSNASRIFLGTRLECAQCHDHPMEPVTQKDFYQLTSYTYGVSNLRNSSGYSTENVTHWNELQAQLKAMNASPALRDGVSRTTSYLKRLTRDTPHELKFPEDYAYDVAGRGKPAGLRTPFGDEAPANVGSRRAAFAEWMVSKRNPRFSRNIANRLWKRVMGMGLIEPVDSLSPVNRPEQPELMEFLAKMIARLDFDERAFLAVLLNTQLYQSESVREEPEPGMPFALRGPLLRRLAAEQVWDSMLGFLVPDVDARKSPLRYDQTGLSRERLVKLTRMSAHELLERSKVELEHREQARAHRIAQAERQTQIKAAKVAGDQATARRLEREWKEIDARFEEGRNAIQMGGPYFAKETDARWANLPPAWVRASELVTPIALGHFLRQFGQSDRREIDAFNKAPNITHSLALMNGPLTKNVLEPQSFLRANVRSIANPAERVRSIFQAILVRVPEQQELQECVEVFASSKTPEQDVIWSLLNAPEFLFQE